MLYKVLVLRNVTDWCRPQCYNLQLSYSGGRLDKNRLIFVQNEVSSGREPRGPN